MWAEYITLDLRFHGIMVHHGIDSAGVVWMDQPFLQHHFIYHCFIPIFYHLFFSLSLSVYLGVFFFFLHPHLYVINTQIISHPCLFVIGNVGIQACI